LQRQLLTTTFAHVVEPGESDSSDEPEEPAARLSRLRAMAARIDTRPGLLIAAERLRARLPGDARFGDPLSTAGAQPVEVVARGVSALRSGRQSVIGELGLAGLQVWQSLSEAAGRGHGDRQLAILFTDLAGFSSWALKVGDAAALELLREVGTTVEGAILDHDGQIVKRLGDGLMATFLAPQAAVEAALGAQAAIEGIEVQGYRPRMRAGIHWGSPRKLGGDYLGVDVNIAARVCDAASAKHAGRVVVSDTILARIDLAGLRAGRAKRLRADGAPRDLHVVEIARL
jgi:adenylate cyclase